MKVSRVRGDLGWVNVGLRLCKDGAVGVRVLLKRGMKGNGRISNGLRMSIIPISKGTIPISSTLGFKY